jgi:predicted MFS family arabinose efflux permease
MSANGPGAGQRRWLVLLVFLIATFNFADRTVFAVLGQSIKVDLGISDLELGLLNGIGFALLYSMSGLPIARWAERGNRVHILSLALAVWSCMTALGGIARSFTGVLVSRVGVGIGEAGFLPPVASLFSDYFVARRRATVMACIGLGGAIGPWLGATLGGYLAEAHSWRTAFLVVGLPGLVLAPLFLFTVREPQRGGADRDASAREPPPSFGAVLRALWAKPAFRHLAVGGALASSGNTAISLFLHAWFVRVHHLGPARAGVLFGLLALVGIGIGSLIGGFGADRASRRDTRWLAWLPALGLLVAGPLYVLAFLQSSVTPALPLLAAGGMLVFTYYSPTLAMTQNLVGPRMRATANFVYGFVGTMVGFGLGPALLGYASDRLATAAFTGGGFAATCPGGVAPAGALPALASQCQAAAATGLEQAMLAVGLLFAWASVHYFLCARSLRQDLYSPEASTSFA